MGPLTITLPEPVKHFVEAEVATGKFRGPDEYVLSLIQEAQRRKARAHADQLLIAGLDSGPIKELTKEVWEEIYQEVERRAKGRTQP